MSELRIKVAEWFAAGMDVMSVLTKAKIEGKRLELTDEQILECVLDDVQAKVGVNH